MRIGIIGAGLTGLTVAYRLSQKGIDVSVFEKDSKVGGLASGFSGEGWKWSLEKYYHHWFISDKNALDLAKELGIEVLYKYPKSSYLIGEEIIRFDNPFSLVTFPYLSLGEKLQQALMLLFMKCFPFWKALEKITAKSFIKSVGGKRAWETLWSPLLDKKFGQYARYVPCSWFWARVKKRSSKLGYPIGGFGLFLEKLQSRIQNNKGKIFLNEGAQYISKKDGIFILKTDTGRVFRFDKLVFTSGFSELRKRYIGLPRKYINRLRSFRYLGAINVVLETNKQLLKDNTYWLNITQRDFPMLAVIEHTNFIDKKYYNGKHLLYLGSYLPKEHEDFNKPSNALVAKYSKFLKKVNSEFDTGWIVKSWVFKTSCAQPIVDLNFSRKIPGFATPIDNLYVTDMAQTWPWDRGTNYAIETGEHLVKALSI